MPYKCSVPNCKGNYTSQNKVKIFSFPKDAERRMAWERAIPRKDFVYTKNSKVCEKHFKPDDIETECEIFDQKNSRFIKTKLEKPRLKNNAIPVFFPDCPTYLNSSATTSRTSPTSKKQKKEEEFILKACKLSKKSKELYDKEYSFSTFAELILCNTKHPCSAYWDTVTKSDNLIFLNLSFQNSVIDLQYSVQINSELTMTVAFKGQIFSELNDQLKCPKRVNNLNEIHQVLDFIELQHKNFDFKIRTLASIIKSLAQDSDLNDENKQNVLYFIQEQLDLLNLKPERYKYSSNITVFSSLFYLISPHAYKFVRSSGFMILPHPSTIHKLCAKYSNLEEIGENFLQYAKRKVQSLDSNQRYVSLMLDEIHIKPYLDFKGGNMMGMAYQNSDIADSAHVFMLQSLFSKYKDVIYIMPVKSITAEVIFSVMKKIIIALEGIGFNVIVIVTDNNSINRKTMSLFCSPPQLSYVYPHPVDSSRPLFYCIDSVHLIKCVRNNWLNQKNGEQAMYFPNFDITQKNYCTASLLTVKNLYEKECGKLLKYGYSLSRKALWPSNMERQNVKLALNLFNSHVAQSLIDLEGACNILNSENTALYINIFKTWFDIMNVKTVFKGYHSQNVMCAPLTADDNDPKLTFLNNFLNWLDKWESMDSDTGRLSRETHTALVLSTCCILEIVKYCTSELSMSFLLPGKIQTDELEYRFSLYRRLAGTQYHVSVRQIFEIENKLRAASLIKLTLNSDKFGEVTIDSFINDSSDASFDHVIPETFFDLHVSDEDIKGTETSLPIITYLAGYCAHSYLKRYNCNDCKDNMVIDKALKEPSYYNFLHSCDRGGLLFPTLILINCITYAYIVIQKLVSSKYETEFLKVMNQRAVACSIIIDILTEHELLVPACKNGHISEKISNIIIHCAVNTFLNNYCKFKNDVKKNATKSRKLIVLSSK